MEYQAIKIIFLMLFIIAIIYGIYCMYNYEKIKDNTSEKNKYKQRLIYTMGFAIIILIVLGVLVCNNGNTDQNSIKDLQSNFNFAKDMKAKYLVHEI